MKTPTAGDLYLSAVERWLEHAETPHDTEHEPCGECEFALAQILQARSVWRRSRYPHVTPEPVPIRGDVRTIIERR